MRHRRDAGFTLVEVMVAIMVSAMMVTAFFSVALTSRMQTGRADHKFAANQVVQRLTEKLRLYVVDQEGIISLPNAGKLAEEGGAGATYALNEGVHDVTTLMQQDINFYDATSGLWKVDNPSLLYCVANAGTMNRACPGMTSLTCGTGTACMDCPSGSQPYKCVIVQLTWNEKGA